MRKHATIPDEEYFSLWSYSIGRPVYSYSEDWCSFCSQSPVDGRTYFVVISVLVLHFHPSLLSPAATCS